MAKGSETSTANAANANTNSTWGLVTAGAINEEIDKDPMCWKSTIEARKMKVCQIFLFKCHCQRKPGRTKRSRSAVYLHLFTV